ncbi:MAG TPA: N-acetylneuraminate synthase [Candidatus Nanoarchaeia archaeon]|nr:N-acetylneuraminate synthase [Candidatus Nanoarchaeia archaeon]
MKIIILGASGFGKEVLSMLQSVPEMEPVGFIDPNLELKGQVINGLPVLGGDEMLPKLRAEGISQAVIAVGDYKARSKLASLLKNNGFNLPTLIHPQSYVNRRVKLGEGVLIYPGVVINADATIGNYVLVNSGCTIGHEVIVEDLVNINPGVNIGGNVRIKTGAYLGIGSSIIQKIVIGAGSIIGAGAVVIRDVPDFMVAVGVPAKVIKPVGGNNPLSDSPKIGISELQPDYPKPVGSNTGSLPISKPLEITVGNRKIGDGHPVFIIAEAGVNHEGNLETAKRLIDVAVEAGADAVKFQTFKAEKLNTRTAPKAQYHIETTGQGGSWFDLLKKEELTEEMHYLLADYCRKKGIMFLSTPYDEDSADLLEKLGVPAFKIASTDLTNIPLLEHVAKKQKPIFLPTGMGSYAEIEEAINTIRNQGNNNLVVLQCTANYPAEIKNANLAVLSEIRRRYTVLVGYSDHTLSEVIPIAATVSGSCLHEKHFTLDKNMSGPDHRTSCNPEELKQLVKHIRLAETCVGNVESKPTKSELENIPRLRKSVVANTNIPQGTIITRSMLAAKRPAAGLHPRHLYDFLGKKAKVNLVEDEFMAYDKVELPN